MTPTHTQKAALVRDGAEKKRLFFHHLNVEVATTENKSLIVFVAGSEVRAGKNPSQRCKETKRYR